MDAFFASVEQLDNPALRGLPVIVGNSPLSQERLRELAQEARGGPPREFIKGMRGVVASASYEARAFGVRSAMPLARALVLCPDAVCVPGRFGRYHEVSEALRRIWGDFSPVVEPMSLDEAYLDLTGSELSGGPVRAIAARLKERIRQETGLTASVGVGSTKLVAKIASDLQKPDGLVVVPQGDEAQTLAPLPVRALPGVGPKTGEALARLGIATIGQLAAFPRGELARIFGLEQAESLQRRAVGIDNNPVQVPGNPKSISKETTLAEDSCDLEQLRAMLRDLAEQVGWTLRQDGFLARCVYIKLRLMPARRVWSPDGGFSKPITRQSTLPVHTDAWQEVYRVAARLLEAAAEETGLAKGEKVVRLIGVGASSLTPIEEIVIQLPKNEKRQSAVPRHAANDADELFEEHARNEKLNSSMDEIRVRFGFGAINFGGRIRGGASEDA
jgi:DNA polymerase-4